MCTSANDDQSTVRRPEQTLKARANPADVFKPRGELWPAIQGVGAAPAARPAMRMLGPSGEKSVTLRHE